MVRDGKLVIEGGNAMTVEEKYEVIRTTSGIQIVCQGDVHAEITTIIDDQNIQHVEIHGKNGFYVTSDFDLSMTIVPGITRSIYNYNLEMAQLVYKDVYNFQCITWQDHKYDFKIKKDVVFVYNGKAVIAMIHRDPRQFRTVITFKKSLSYGLKVLISMFPFVQFI